ncbi:uncharacterized protein N7482_006056 [Penicillium canariense]|uniref:Uncharacterized protein n=1 Tax=Penicillium canariense TaxID=189055 RepID=A0A9W9LNS5_9EURO|nr:uncharacterized protein N7482_006056 [Penicillium canariense]KAJ5167275.1 hypothetical protein N7482_006056 [Penicillium canariense]
MIERFGADWGFNARGIYYRHHFSRAWVTPGHDLWLPSVCDVHWSHASEDSRRARAEKFLKHSLDNERFKKSEYAWEADAWQDVFGRMRDDPSLVVDKREYNTIKEKRHKASCLLDGQPKFIRRIPDATFGLATFQPTDYPDYPESLDAWDLDHDRLEALLLHRHCGLIADPHWGDTNLVFPFAVYEAKGWSGDPREARHQASSAGAVYLDMLDNLARKPGIAGGNNRPYQTAQSCNHQVFVLTSFGAHWHILVGYKRPRLEKEYAGHRGLSDSVYVFQRIWSSRVVTKRKAWELLSLVDQIHSWGVTDHRDFVIRHLKAWHAFGRLCYISDAEFLAHKMAVDGFTAEFQKLIEEYGKPVVPMHSTSLHLAGWAKYFTGDIQDRLRERAVFHFKEAVRQYAGTNKDDGPVFFHCVKGQCGPVESPGYPLKDKEEYLTHRREVHGDNDTTIANLECALEELDSILEEDRNEPKARQMKRSGSEGPGPATKRHRDLRYGAHEIDVGKGKARVIDLTDD